jgi:hypothetical protein
MPPDDRRDDWRHGVDENLASLNTGQRVTDKLIEDLELKYDEFDRLVRGDPEKDTDGVIGRLHRIENAVDEIRVIMIKTKMAEVEVTKTKWELSGRLIERILILAVALLLGWDKLFPLYKKIVNHRAGPVEIAIEKAKHKKGAPIIRYHPIESDNLAPRVLSIEWKQRQRRYRELLDFIQGCRPDHHVFFVDQDIWWAKPFERLPFAWEGKAVYVLPRNAGDWHRLVHAS